MDLYKTQVEREQKTLLDSEIKVWQDFVKDMEAGRGDNTVVGRAVQRLSLVRLTEAITEWFNMPLRGMRASYRKTLKEYYTGKESELALLVISTVVRSVMARPIKAGSLAGHIRNSIVSDLLIKELKIQQPKLESYVDYEYKSRGNSYIISRKKKLAEMKSVEKIQITIPEVLALLSIYETANLGITTTYKAYLKGKTQVRVKVSEDFAEITQTIMDSVVKNSIKYRPLLIEPKKWGEGKNGGYHFIGNRPLIKMDKDTIKTYREYLSNNVAPDLSRLHNVINGIQGTKWTVNKFIYDVIQHIVEGNIEDYEKPFFSCIGGIPYQKYIDINTIVKAEDYGEMVERGGKLVHKNKADYKRFYTDREVTVGKLQKIRSKRVMFNLMLDIAKSLLPYDGFYFSYTVDFRGRLYPLQQVFNPQSESHGKALLEFANKRVLDEDGVYWTKVHVANTYGKDKLPFEKRVEWVDNNLVRIKGIADSPFEDISFWNEADEPLLFLSACKALTDGLRGIPVGLPVHLDATCSGIQIYSGLLKDADGAEAVNVVNNSTGEPSDIYQQVANKVNEYLASGDYPKTLKVKKSDGEELDVSTYEEANSLKGRVTRKLTKQNVMTTPYSVTKRGMYDQLRGLFEEAKENGKQFWKGDQHIATQLLVELNSKAISEVVKGASLGQTFVKDVAKIVSGENKPIIWKTPFFGLPVIQSRRKTETRTYRSALGRLYFKESTKDIDKQGQGNSIAPNFVHSLDATLMYLTVERLLAEGVEDFALIHDSFATHPNDIKYLNKYVRSSYIRLFDSNPLHDWVEQLQVGVTNELPNPEEVMLDTLHLPDVSNSTFIFS